MYFENVAPCSCIHITFTYMLPFLNSEKKTAQIYKFNNSVDKSHIIAFYCMAELNC